MVGIPEGLSAGIRDGASDGIFVGALDTVGSLVGGSVGEAEGCTVISSKQKLQVCGHPSLTVLPLKALEVSSQYMSILAFGRPLNHSQVPSSSPYFLVNVK